MSSSEALKWLNWIPLAVRRLSHRYIAVENAIKGNIPQHFESFKSTLRSSHGYNTTNGYLPRLPKPKTECGRRVSYFRSIIFFTVLFNNLRKPMSCANFKKNLTRFLMDKHFQLMDKQFKANAALLIDNYLLIVFRTVRSFSSFQICDICSFNFRFSYLFIFTEDIPENHVFT